MHSEAAWRRLLRALQLFLAAAALRGVVVGRGELVVNAGVGLALTLAVALVERRAGVSVAPSLVAWLAAAAALHVVGMLLGLYNPPTGYDHLTHAVSGSVVAAAGAVLVGVWERRDPAVRVPAAFGVALALAVVAAGGVAWEVVEFAAARGVQLGLADTLSDLVYNLVGGAVAVALGRSYLAAVAAGLAADLDGRSE